MNVVYFFFRRIVIFRIVVVYEVRFRLLRIIVLLVNFIDEVVEFSGEFD